MKKITSIFCLLLCSTLLYSQNETKNWYFGLNSGITFSTSPPTYLPGGQLNTYEGTVTISDNSGMLLFYSDGVTVYNRNHIQMPNGFALTGNSSTTQCLAIPKPGSVNEYYLFTPPDEYSSDSLRYSIVDMSLNSGYGDVTVKNIGLLAHPTEKLAAVYHNNGSDIWLISHTFLSANFYAWLITPSGISAPVISTAGNVYSGNTGNKVGQLKISPCGNKLANAVNNSNYLELFDFNRTTGVVSNPILLGVWTNAQSYGVYGLEFSPDGSRLYTTTLVPGYLLQFNLLAGNASAIIASQDTIALSPHNYNGALQLGEDGKIYMAKYMDNFLACITSPNQLGNACNYVENYVALSPSYSQLGLPNFLASWFCPSSPKGINEYGAADSFILYPNPANTTLSVILRGNGKITVTNLLGDVIMEKKSSFGKDVVDIDVSSFSPGIYFVKTGNEVKKFVKE